MIVELAARGRERRIALAHIGGEGHVAEHDGGGRHADQPLGFERRPGRIGTAFDPAVRLAARRRATSRRHGRIEVLLVPELRAERLLVEEVHVVHALGRKVPHVFHQRVVGTRHIGEAALAGRRDAGLLGLGDLRPGEPEHAVASRPGVGADQHRAAGVAGVERQQRHVGTRLVAVAILAHVSDVPAEMPDRGLRRRRRRGRNLGEQHQDIVGRRERRQAGEAGARRAGKLSRIEGDGGVGIDRIEMQMMEAGSREHVGLS